MEKLQLDTIKAEVEGIETGLEVLVSNASNNNDRLMSTRSLDLVERMEKRMDHIKEIIDNECNGI